MGNRYLKPTQKELIKEFFEIIGKPKRYVEQIKRDTLESIVIQLRVCDPKIKKIRGIRPKTLVQTSESISGYRSKMSNYIFENTGIDIPVNSNIPAWVYDKIANYLYL